MSNSEQCSESGCLLGRSCSSVSTLATTQIGVKTLPTTPQSWVKTAMSTVSHQKRGLRRTVSVDGDFNFSSQAKIQHVIKNYKITGPVQKISIHVINTFWLLWSWSSPSPRVLIADSLIAWYWPNFCFSWGQGTGAGKGKTSNFAFWGKKPLSKSHRGGNLYVLGQEIANIIQSKVIEWEKCLFWTLSIFTSSTKKLPISFNHAIVQREIS